MQANILVTGASGNVGQGVVTHLKGQGVPFRVTTHHADQANDEQTYLDFERPESFAQALVGVERIFLMRPPQIADAKKYFLPLIEAAKEQGVRQIVFMSLLGAEYNIFVPHAKIERYIKESKIPYTFLRPSFFMQNLIEQHGDDLRKNHTLYVPAGHARTSFIDARDIGEAGARCLVKEIGQHEAYTLTGSEALTYDEVAQIFTEELGYPVTYPNPSGKDFKEHMLAQGEKEEFVKVMSMIYLTTRLGMAKKVTQDLPRLLGRAPRTVRDFVRDYKDEVNNVGER